MTVVLPHDLVSFLQEGQQLSYAAETCEAGRVLLLSFAKLQLQRFPVETRSLDVYKTDPHFPKLNSYLVLGVNLVESCDGYDPVGILLWLPVESRYGVWDSSHCNINMFARSVMWSDIARDPVHYINAGWCYEDSADTEPLVPWPQHPYASKQIYEPQTAEI